MGITQKAGTWTLGNKVAFTSNNLYCRILLEGGLLQATGAVTFSSRTDKPTLLAFADGADIALEAAAGATLDLSNFSYEGAAKVTLQGAGTIKLPTVGAPTGITVKDAWSYDVSAEGAEMSVVAVEGKTASVAISGSNVSVAELGSVAGTLRIDGTGLAITALAEGAKITGAVEVGEKFKVGDTVVTSADAAVLRAIAAGRTSCTLHLYLDDPDKNANCEFYSRETSAMVCYRAKLLCVKRNWRGPGMMVIFR